MNQKALEKILQDLHYETADITGSAIVSTDGLSIATLLRHDTNPDRVGGMSAALLALSNRATKELSCGNMTQTVVQGDGGFILEIQAGKETLLVVTAKPDAKLGMILFHARQAAKNIMNFYS